MDSDELYSNFKDNCRKCLMTLTALDDDAHKLMSDPRFHKNKSKAIVEALSRISYYASKVDTAASLCRDTRECESDSKLIMDNIFDE